MRWLLVETAVLAHCAASYGVMFPVLLAAAAPAPEVKG